LSPFFSFSQAEPSQGPITIDPSRPEGAASIPDLQAGGDGKTGSLIIGVIMIVFGLHFLLRNIPFFHPYYWWFWDMGWKFFWPSALILAGLFVILRGSRK
jgi:hypothetical protein